jgi:hypothetical protein
MIEPAGTVFVRSSAGADASTGPPTPPVIERRGRRWIFVSFLLCPCHLPLTLAIVMSLAGGTVVGGLLRDHLVVAGLVITFGWVVGTANGFRLVRHAQRGTCPVPWRARRRFAAGRR